MAIIVNNPSTVQFSGVLTEPQDPAAIALEAGFTEELAQAMQLPGQQSGSDLASQDLTVSSAESKLNDLQILPADVLLNAVGEANFAFSAQGSQLIQTTDSTKVMAETGEQLAILDATDSTQAAELAAAALAAQMASQLPTAPTNLQPAQTGLSLEAVGKVDASMPLNEVMLGQANGLDKATQTPTQAALIETTLDANLQVSNSLNNVVPNQVDESISGKQELQTEKIFLVDSKSISNVKPDDITVVQVAFQANTISNGESSPNMTESQASQPLDGLNQSAAKALNNGQNGLENIALQNSIIAPNASQTAISSNPDSVDTSFNGVNKMASTEKTSQLENELQTVFDLARSDVARPGSEGSANPVDSSGFTQNYANDKFNEQSLANLESSLTAQLDSESIFSSKSLQADGVLNDSVEKFVQSKVEAANQESAFKFDAKLGAQAPNLGVALGAVNASQPIKPVSMGGVSVLQDKPVSLAAPVVPVDIITPIQENQVLVTDEAIAVSQTRIAGNSQDLIVETSVQTTTVITTENSSNQPGTTETSTTTARTATLQAVKTSVLEDVVSLSESQLESEAIARSSNVPSQGLNGVLLNDDSGSRNESNFQANQLPNVASTGNATTTTTSQENQNTQVMASSSVSQQSAAEASKNAILENDTQSVGKSFEEVSSTFVNSLVGGPQRSVTTAMDWVALKPQEPPRPVMPHELRLDAGAVQVEIQKMVKQGGGHVVMELTPPDQSKFTIELKLDDNGGAYLRVEGVSDSTKTRLEQSAPQLQEQFQQMGLNLQLDMRQNRDTSSSAAGQWVANESGSNNLQKQDSLPQVTRAEAAERARKNSGGQVYLYA